MPKKKVYIPDPAYNRQTRTMATEPNTANPIQGGSSEGRPLNLLKFDANICEKFDHKTMDAHTWLHKFLLIASYYKWTNEQLCFYFGLHLLTEAYNWFSNLPDTISTNFDQLKEHLISRFSLHGSTKWSIMPEIFEMKQKHDQPVQEFIQQVQMKSKLIDLPEDQLIGALMKGFLPHIRADLIRSEINNMSDVIKEATISEQANKIKSNQPENILSEERLIKAIQSAMSISHIQPQATSQTHSTDNNYTSKKYYQPNHTYWKTQTYNKPKQALKGPRVNPNYICYRCDRQGEHYKDQCPHIDTICHFCSKVGHIQRACKSKKQ